MQLVYYEQMPGKLVLLKFFLNPNFKCNFEDLKIQKRLS